jgi:hypothetical protein
MEATIYNTALHTNLVGPETYKVTATHFHPSGKNIRKTVILNTLDWTDEEIINTIFNG